MRRTLQICLFVVSALASSAANAGSLSLDCAQASRPVEKIICGNAALRDLDGKLGVAVSRAQAHDPRNAEAIAAEERQWLSDLDQVSCFVDSENSVACFAQGYQARLEEVALPFTCSRAIQVSDKSTSEADHNGNRPNALNACAAEVAKIPRVRKLERLLYKACEKLREPIGSGDTGPHDVDSCKLDANRFLLDLYDR